ncbi:hypothetical protein N7468_001551 [Penicillium chermesinum]|uniref:N-acetylglucosaminylphosphatidylinositol deacetylase n=1 Tax=Penicillium chermesinum TaxID=63820 RepID=A0A9W9PJ08_9EURO|nr:uncharacterized protein N7468_001551 [Penicillium chermesinum]KAJ5246568.1 hypothetical protein N7468_001551 [Penicillium chermesinum]KAJ6144837.1 hypothetical protein N7470_008732 [Penicillium chermesinum]
MSLPTSNLTAIAVALSALLLFWSFSATSSSPFTRNFPSLHGKRICLLIAHPDDEAMFFAPTVLALTKPELGNHLKILCLSTGDADGLGETRRKELTKSALHLGLRSEEDVLVIDDPSRFPDSMSKSWPEEDISGLLATAFAPEVAATLNGTAKKNSSKPPSATIDVLLTFDKEGISNHPNHRSLYHGARHFIRSLMQDKAGYACPITLYTLTSTPMYRKYVGVLDVPVTMVQGALANTFARLSRAKKDGAGPARLLFVNSIAEWFTAQSAMTKGHKSQMVWFRWGWITISRYMFMNDLKQERV